MNPRSIGDRSNPADSKTTRPEPDRAERGSPQSGPPEPVELADALRHVSNAVAADLVDASPNTLQALAQAAELVEVAANSQRAIVAAARARGAPWSTIGGVLGITRQAAYQRFGQGAARAAIPDYVEYPDAAAVTAEMLASMRKGDWDAVISRTSTMIQRELGADGLRQAWQTVAGVEDVLGADPLGARRVGAVTVAEILLHAAGGDELMRLTFNSEGLIVGIWFDHPNTRVTEG